MRGFLLFLSLLLFSSLAFAAEEKKVHFQMGDYEYAIPEAYFDVEQQTDCNSQSALLKFLVPTFEALSDRNSIEFLDAGDFAKRSSMLIEVNNTKHTMSKRLRFNLQSTMEIFVRGNLKLPQLYYGLEVHMPELTQKRIQESALGPSLGNYIFVHYGHNKEIAAYIDCPLPGSLRSSTCKHHFVENDAIVSFSYDFRFLPYWHSLERKARALVKSWAVKKVEKKLPQCCQTFDCYVKGKQP